MPSVMNPVQGRWGWYACDYPTFSKVKDLHRLTLRDLRATRRHGRWAAKLPHNRVQRHRDGTTTPIAEPPNLGTSQDGYEWVLAEYRAIRRPCADAASVCAPDLPRAWEDRLAQLREFYAG